MIVPSRIPVIDAHQHLWDPALFSYSWMRDLPQLNRRHLVEEYQVAMQGTGISGSVYVDSDVDHVDLAAETLFILGLAEDPKQGILGAVVGAKVECADFRAHMASFLGHPKLKGVRRVLHNRPDETSQKTQFVENVRLLANWRLTFDLCVSWRQLPLATNLVRQCPEVSFILDHCGGPDVRTRALYPWRKHLRSIAREPNVSCKISGLLSDPDASGWTSADLRPYVAHVIDCFGWERVMWGSDWPVSTLSTDSPRWLEVVKELVQTADRSQQEGLFCRNAQRVYGLPAQSFQAGVSKVGDHADSSGSGA